MESLSLNVFSRLATPGTPFLDVSPLTSGCLLPSLNDLTWDGAFLASFTVILIKQYVWIGTMRFLST